MFTPFTMITAMMLPTDEYTNVTIDNGKIMSDADKNIVVGLGFPGLTENLKLTLNEEKTKIVRPWEFHYLGYAFSQSYH